jgi:hypothetical protein
MHVYRAYEILQGMRPENIANRRIGDTNLGEAAAVFLL